MYRRQSSGQREAVKPSRHPATMRRAAGSALGASTRPSRHRHRRRRQRTMTMTMARVVRWVGQSFCRGRRSVCVLTGRPRPIGRRGTRKTRLPRPLPSSSERSSGGRPAKTSTNFSALCTSSGHRLITAADYPLVADSTALQWTPSSNVHPHARWCWQINAVSNGPNT